MNKVEIIKSFNEILGDFLQQIAPIIGTTYHYYYTKIIVANALLPSQYFINYVHNSEKPLIKYIETRDENYFTNTYDPKEHLGHLEHLGQSMHTETALMEIIRLKGIYSQLSDESKDNVWNILQALLHLSKEYLALK